MYLGDEAVRLEVSEHSRILRVAVVSSLFFDVLAGAQSVPYASRTFVDLLFSGCAWIRRKVQKKQVEDL